MSAVSALWRRQVHGRLLRVRSNASRRGASQWSRVLLRVELHGTVGASPVGRKNVADLIALKPDLILAIGNAGIPPLLELARSVPIVFTVVVDPVGAGFVQSLSRPGGNVTGFLMFEYSLSGKWPELLKQLAPDVTRAAVLRDPALPAGIGQFAVIQAVAPSQGLDVTAVNVADEQEIARGIESFAQSPGGGLIVTASAKTVIHRKVIVALAAKHRLPAVYIHRAMPTIFPCASYLGLTLASRLK